MRINIAYSSGEINILIFNDPIRAYRKYFRKVVGTWICRIKSSSHWRKLRINIAYSSGEIKLWTFQWRHSRIPEILSKKLFKPNWCKFSPLFIGANCALILLIVAEKSNFEIFNAAIRAYRKYFRKFVCTWNMQNKVLYSLAQTAH